MDNVREIRRKKELYFILPEDCTDNIASEILHSTVIIAYLYYTDTLEKYLSYLDNIPIEIPIYIISSNSETSDKILLYIKSKTKNKPRFIKKENRGRDISTLLVTCKEIIKSYKYICFLHDKKEKYDYLKLDTERWIANLWGNCIKTENYIRNVLALFERESSIGLLVPPEPIGDYRNEWYSNNSWVNAFDCTFNLAKSLHLNCDIRKEFSPITLGTVFWGRVSALRKLFDKEWSYTDFLPEPLPSDGTISHAVERILGYVVQDAGYDTGTIMASTYAEHQMVILQESLTAAFDILREELGISNFIDLKKFWEQKMRVCDFCKKNRDVFLYGAGKKGIACLHLMRLYGYKPKGFIVSDKNEQDCEIEGISIEEWRNIKNIKNMGIIVAVSNRLQEEIIQNLNEVKFTNYINYC